MDSGDRLCRECGGSSRVCDPRVARRRRAGGGVGCPAGIRFGGLRLLPGQPRRSLRQQAEEKASLESPVVQSAISAIHRDIEAVEIGWLWPELRQRAEQEGKDWASTIV